METVVIIGAGASGMMAALSALEAGDKKVILLERQQRPGRKLLATGNGRCNLTNTGAKPENYHGAQEDFPAPVLKRFGPKETLDFFHSLGLLTVEEYGGRVYPLSDHANSVADVLRFALQQRGAELRCSCPALSLERRDKGYAVVTEAGAVMADYVIVACGGAAGAKLGGVMDGYKLLKPLGHKAGPLYPALVQILSDSPYPRSLKGVRADGRAELFKNGELLASSQGEIQFTDTGISGPAAFDLSRCVAQGGEGLELRLDLLKDYELSYVLCLLEARRRDLPQIQSGEIFTGMLHNRLGRMIVKYAGLPGELPLSQLSGQQLKACACAAKDFRLNVTGTLGFDQAQVTAGGIKTGGFDPNTLESWFMPRLFVCGELLDVDGDCGGYNLQWAWSSGYVAGRLGK